MDRKKFLKKSLLASIGIPLIASGKIQIKEPLKENRILNKKVFEPLAITMWDFSWLENKWPGAGYEDWDLVLDQLVERGYNAIRMDAYPHLVSENAEKEWTLIPVWRVSDWGSPAINKVKIQPMMNEFISKCKDRNIKIGLSSWFREDLDNTRMKISSPIILGEIWIKTLKSIENAGLLDNIFYVDLCNEWPGSYWAPYFKNNPPELTWGAWYTENVMQWMEESIKLVREEFPNIPLGYSIEMHKSRVQHDRDLSFLDYQEPHIWMSNSNSGEYYKKVGYNYDTEIFASYDNLQANGERIYRENPEHWHQVLFNAMDYYINYSKQHNIALMTTECWGVVDYKDWPLLNWDWIKELCELGTKRASDSGRWAAVATSNFCGPQFVGMWRDVDWHRSLTDYIKNSNLNEKLRKNKLIRRILET